MNLKWLWEGPCPNEQCSTVLLVPESPISDPDVSSCLDKSLQREGKRLAKSEQGFFGLDVHIMFVCPVCERPGHIPLIGESSPEAMSQEEWEAWRARAIEEDKESFAPPLSQLTNDEEDDDEAKEDEDEPKNV